MKGSDGLKELRTNMAQSEQALNSLAPVCASSDEVRKYHTQFSFVFANDDIRNVAVTGPNASGKSSLIKGWREYEKGDDGKPKRKYLTVSMAHFPAPVAETDSDPSAKAAFMGAVERQVEGEIINQLAYKVSPSKAPLSQLRPVSELEKAKACRYAALTAVVLALVWASAGLVASSWFYEAHPLRAQALIGLQALVLTALVFMAMRYYLLHRPLRGSIRRLRVGGGEMELFSRDDSAIDRYLGEIVYLLDKSQVDVVVFEDIDRFGLPQVFERLRGVNELINDPDRVTRPKDKRVVRFFYLMRDDMFDSEQRRKFFDYIIPVVPHADPSNSYQRLQASLDEAGIACDRLFLVQLSSFVEDSRALSDLVNEAVCYRDRLYGPGMPIAGRDALRLVALIAYKVSCPGDFAKLQVGKGVLKALLEASSQILSKAINSIDNRLHEVETGLASETGDKRIALQCEKEKLLSDRGDLSRGRLPIACQYADMTLKLDEHDGMEGKGAEIAHFLVLSGYVDETYAYYISNREGGPLSVHDREFWLSTLQGEHRDRSFELDDPASVLSLVGQNQYDIRGFRNYSLLRAALESNTIAAEAILLRAIAEGDHAFICGYVASRHYRSQVHLVLNQRFPQYVVAASGPIRLTPQEKRSFFQRIASDNVANLTDEGKVAMLNFARRDVGFLRLSDGVDRSQFVSGLKEVGYVLQSVPGEYDTEVLAEIFSAGMFETRASLVRLYLMACAGYSGQDLDSAGLLGLLEADDEGIALNLEKDLAALAADALDSEVSLGYGDDALEMVLNSALVDDRDKRRYIKAMPRECQVYDLSRIRDASLWPDLLANQCVFPDEGNMLRYYAEFGFDEGLVSLLNTHGDGFYLTCEEVDSLAASEGLSISGKDFARGIINLRSVDEYVYRSMLQSLSCRFESLEIVDLEDWQIETLVDTGTLAASRVNIMALRNSLSGAKYELDMLLRDVDAYSSVVSRRADSSHAAVDVDIVYEALLSERVDDAKKMGLLEKVDVLPYSSAMGEAVVAVLLERHFDENDIERLNAIFLDAESSELQQAVVRRCASSIGAIIGSQMKLVKELLLRVVAEPELTYDERLDAIRISSEDFKSEDFLDAFKSARLDGYYDAVRLTGSARVKKTASAMKMLELLKQRQYISSYSEISGAGEYKVNARRSLLD